MESISSCSEKIEKDSLKHKILQGEFKGFNSTEQILDSIYCRIDES